MKTQILFTALTMIFAIGSANAATPSAKCSACTQADTLAKDIGKLDYKKDADKDKGGLQALEAVKQMESFEKTKAQDPERLATFKSLVNLAREASPYDGESQLAQMIAGLTLKDASLKKAYDAELASMPKAAGSKASCKTQLLESHVRESSCLKKANVQGQAPNGPKQAETMKSCTEKFNFDTCLDTAQNK